MYLEKHGEMPVIVGVPLDKPYSPAADKKRHNVVMLQHLNVKTLYILQLEITD